MKKYTDYIVVRVEGRMRKAICTNNKADWYGTPKIFYYKEDAEKWVNDHKPQYSATYHYEIEEA